MAAGSGPDNHRWTGGRNLSSKGYPRLKVGRQHPLAHSNGYAYEHLLVWVSAGNPIPERGYEIHHINEHKQDNRIENLELISKRRHNMNHASIKTRDEGGKWQPKANL